MKETLLKQISFSITVVVIAVILLQLVRCESPESARKALEDAGYHPIEVGGYGWFDCSEDDWYATKFRAYSADSSRIVEGCVCEGFFKGKTIRLK